ncbi:integrase [Fusobacterium necrophorum DJ-2]|uniref:Integrase n=1 Tax=Fusobacterium necrophorum DJ-2 TaxID=1441737 RepID=A0AB73C1Y7_9FUSO|nr:integrase [Fusobacterium necrophorum DJ-2]KDE72729.1 integrase [Fusobacterium necrophorum BFTR-2]
MSKKGCSPDNSAREGFFGRIKNEMFYSRDWKNISLEEFKTILNEYLIWYNKRIKMCLGFKSPQEYRQSLGII